MFERGRIVKRKTSKFRGGMITLRALPEETLFDAQTCRARVSWRIRCPFIFTCRRSMSLGLRNLTRTRRAQGTSLAKSALLGVAAAIANAIWNATGKQICDIAIKLDKLFKEGRTRMRSPCADGARH